MSGYDELTVAEKKRFLATRQRQSPLSRLIIGLTYDDMRFNDLLRYTDSGTRYKDDKRSKWTHFLDLFRQRPNAEEYTRVLAYKDACRLHQQYLSAVEEEKQALLRQKRSYWERLNGYDVCDRNLVNVAPLQLGEEVIDLHFEDARNSRAGTIFSASASKRGSPRSGSRSE